MNPQPSTPAPAGLTADQLLSVALRLSNSNWCRHWMHWNYPQRSPWLMAVNCREADGTPASLYAGDLERRGFRLELLDGAEYWIVERVQDDGTPYTGHESGPATQPQPRTPENNFNFFQPATCRSIT